MADDDKLVQVMEKGFETLADLIGQTNSRLDETRSELSARLEAANARLEATNQQVGALGAEVRKNGSRLDNLISIAGGESRALREDVDELKMRVEALEKKAS